MWTLNRVGRPEIYYQIPNSNKYSQVSRWRSQEQEERVSTTTALCVAGEVVTHAFTSGARATAAAFSFRAVSVVALFSDCFRKHAYVRRNGNVRRESSLRGGGAVSP
jgi:hypothetical protein